ncbi:MAG: zinc-dependent metalloprotease [Polyangiaceae bacterium]|nr:zinc-dependent metalloprotease [Polyangiaceae bacterium]
MATLMPLAACHESESLPPRPLADAAPQPAEEDPFIPVYPKGPSAPEGVTPPEGAQAQAPVTGVDKAGKSFYVGVRKSALSERWFLSAYLKQLHPDPVGRAAVTLGTRVVSFRVQNGRLFVFDVDDRKTVSDTFDPEVVVEAYPIIDGSKLGKGFDNYVVFDPTAGENRFSVLNDAEFDGDPLYPNPLEVEVTYAQNFRAIADGATFEQVFSGHFRDPDQLPDRNGLVPNDFSVAGTLGLALRRYREGEGFTPKPMPDQDFYFRGPPRFVPNTNRVEFSAARWNLRPDAPPVRWLIAPSLLKAQAERYPDYDLAGAVKRGIEGWNAAFGFEALQADFASPEQSFADDDVNYFIFDESIRAFFAFADWRTNPNTSEIRGASVYLPEAIVRFADLIHSDDEAARTLSPWLNSSVAPVPRFAWGPLQQDRLCSLDLERFVLAAHSATTSLPLTKKEKVERVLESFVSHEIGHTLGLRHNFKGSLQPPSSSVMDYTSDADTLLVFAPGAYDVDALRYLYDLSPEPPAQPFCTDEGVALDPTCNRYDSGSDPLVESLIPSYQSLLELFAQGLFSPDEELILRVDTALVAGELLDYVRAAETPELKSAAWAAVFSPLRSPLDPSFLPENVALWTRRVLSLFLLDDPFDSLILDIDSPLVSDTFTPELAADLGSIVIDEAGLYGIEARGDAVDVLKRLRAPSALSALESARATIEATLPSLDGEAKVLAEDLLKRIARATDPYFD